MVESLLDDIRENVAEPGKHINRARETISDTCDEVLGQSRRAVKRARHAAEDLAEDAQHLVKKHPVPSVAGAVMVGLAVGFLAGWTLGSRE